MMTNKFLPHLLLSTLLCLSLQLLSSSVYALEECQQQSLVTVSSNFEICIPQARYLSASGETYIWAKLDYRGQQEGNLIWSLKDFGTLASNVDRATIVETLEDCEGRASVSVTEQLDICIPLATYSKSTLEEQEIWASLKYQGQDSNGTHLWKLDSAADIKKKLVAVEEQCLEAKDKALADLDLANPVTKEVYNALKLADPYHAYPLFLQVSADFLNWTTTYSAGLSTSVHESNHFIDSALETGTITTSAYPDGLSFNCTELSGELFYLLGKVYQTSIENKQTENYSIVEETIDAKFKTASRYNTYIEGAKNYDNDFAVLLDELNAYVGDGWFQLQFQKSGLSEQGEYYSEKQFQIDGIANFMLYLQHYLKSARLNYPETYAAISSQKDTIGYINKTWSLAEKVLTDAYAILTQNNSLNYIFFTLGNEASGIAHLKAVYTDELLNELDLLGISHQNNSYWDSSYFSNE